MKKISATLLSAAWLASCSDSSDPSVAGQADLAPPTNLTTVTGDTQVELRWNGANFEDDFKGYHVFMATSSIAALKTSSAPLSPKGVDIAKAQPVSRCAANNAFFKAFGVTKATETACDDVSTTATVVEDPTAAGVQKAKVVCYDPSAPTKALGTDATTSLDVVASSSYASGQGLQRCLIKGLTNSTTYSFFVVAVKGDSYDTISWTSNVFEDTPATVVFNSSVTIGAAKYTTINLSATSAVAAATAGTAAACSGAICTLTGTNSGTTASLYLGRDNVSGAYQQRVWLSTGSGSTVEIAYRGPLTNDETKTSPDANGDAVVSTSVPGDMATSGAATVNPYAKGSKFVVYDNQVYDIKYTLSGVVYYGRIVIGNLSYASDKNSDVTFNATVLMQGQANQLEYFTDGVSAGDEL